MDRKGTKYCKICGCSEGEVEKLFCFPRNPEFLNGSTDNAPEAKQFKRSVSEGTGHSEFWRKSREDISQWRYMRNPNSRHSMWKPPSQIGWLHTLEAFIGVEKLLKEHGVESFKPMSFNQDPLENLFGAIRSSCGCNDNPTVPQFIDSFKTQVINNLANQSFKNTNCEKDEFELLSDLRSLIELNLQRDSETNLNNLRLSPKPQLTLDSISLDIENFVKSGSMECLSVANVAGYIVKRLCLKFSCDISLTVLCSDEFEPCNSLIFAKEPNQNNTQFHYPSENLVIFVGKVVTGIEEFMKTNKSEINLTQKILTHLSELIDYNFLNKCIDHSLLMRDHIIVSTCKVGLPWYCKRLSRELNQQRKLSKADGKLTILQHM